MRQYKSQCDDGLYVVQECYNGGNIVGGLGGFPLCASFEDESEARQYAADLRESPYFEGDYVRIITRDGELVESGRAT